MLVQPVSGSCDWSTSFSVIRRVIDEKERTLPLFLKRTRPVLETVWNYKIGFCAHGPTVGRMVLAEIKRVPWYKSASLTCWTKGEAVSMLEMPVTVCRSSCAETAIGIGEHYD